MSGKSWEHFPHDSNIGIRGIGTSLSESFEQAAIALSATITQPGKTDCMTSVDINCEAEDLELMLSRWLDVLISCMTDCNLVFNDYQVRISHHRLSARACGETLDVPMHGPVHRIAGISPAATKVIRHPDGMWIAQSAIRLLPAGRSTAAAGAHTPSWLSPADVDALSNHSLHK